MFAWLINHLLIYVIIFFWGYLTMKWFHGGWLAILGALFLALSYYDLSSKHTAGFFADVLFIGGALDYKFYLRERTASLLAYGIQTGWSNVQEEFTEQIQAVLQKLNLHRYIGNDSQQSNQSKGFDQAWYDEQLFKAQQEANRAKEEAQRAKEKAQREKQKNQNSNQQKQSNQGNKKALDPTKLKDAYEILGVEYGTDKETCKKHFRKLMAMYHPDKLAGFTGYRRKQMEQEAKDIGVAWETVSMR